MYGVCTHSVSCTGYDHTNQKFTKRRKLTNHLIRHAENNSPRSAFRRAMAREHDRASNPNHWCFMKSRPSVISLMQGYQQVSFFPLVSVPRSYIENFVYLLTIRTLFLTYRPPGVALLPFVDANRLGETLTEVYPDLTIAESK